MITKAHNLPVNRVSNIKFHMDVMNFIQNTYPWLTKKAITSLALKKDLGEFAVLFTKKTNASRDLRKASMAFSICFKIKKEARNNTFVLKEPSVGFDSSHSGGNCSKEEMIWFSAFSKMYLIYNSKFSFNNESFWKIFVLFLLQHRFQK